MPVTMDNKVDKLQYNVHYVFKVAYIALKTNADSYQKVTYYVY